MMMVTWTHHVNNNSIINTNARVVCVCVWQKTPLPFRQKKDQKSSARLREKQT
jgi:hypothetical protein